MIHDHYTDRYITDILAGARTIAIVGASANTNRPSYFAMKYLLGKGFKVYPINPGLAGKELLGEMVYGSLADLPGPVDIVDIFRNAEAAGQIVKEVIRCRTSCKPRSFGCSSASETTRPLLKPKGPA